MAPSNNQARNQSPRMDDDYYSRIGEEIQRGVDPQELVEQGHESRLLAELTTSHLGVVAATSELSRPIESEPTKLEQFTARFSWVPRYEQEVNIAVNGIEATLRGKRINQVDRLIDNIRGYARASSITQNTLRRGLVDENELSTVSADKIRSFVDEYGHYGPGYKGRNAIIDAIATQQLFKNEVLTGTGPWPHRSSDGGEISLKRLSPFVKMVNELSDEALLKMWKETFDDQAERAKFWLSIIAGDNPHPRIVESLRERSHKGHGAYRR